MGSILRADLFLVDELRSSPLDPVAANHLFRLVAAAYETNFPPDAVAILDRLLHHCQVVVLRGESYRLREDKKVMLTAR